MKQAGIARQVGVRELKTRAAALVREVGETRQPLVITNRGRAVARLVPLDEDERIWADSLAVLAEMEALAQEIGKHLPPGSSAVEAVREQRRDL